MLLRRPHDALMALRSAARRHRAVQYLYIASFCLAYLLPSIWSARTLFYFITVPLALVALDYQRLRSTLRHPIFLLSAAYLAILILTSLAAPDLRMKVIGDNLLHSIRVLVLLVVTADLMQRDKQFLKTFGLILSAAAAVGAVINVVAFYGVGGLNRTMFGTRLEGLPGVTIYYNSNVVSAMFGVACVMGASLLPSRLLSRREFAVAALATLILFVAVVLTHSRGPLLGVMAGLAILILLGRSRRHILWLGIAAAVVLAALWVWTPLVTLLVDRGASLRPMVWAHYWQMALERPWLGYGLSRDVGLYLPNVDHPLLSAHNIMLSALVRGGVAAALVLLCLVLTCLYQSWRSWREHSVLMPLALMTSAVIATAVDHEITATSLGWPWLLFWIPVAMCLGAGVQTGPEGGLERRAVPAAGARTPAR